MDDGIYGAPKTPRKRLLRSYSIPHVITKCDLWRSCTVDQYSFKTATAFDRLTHHMSHSSLHDRRLQRIKLLLRAVGLRSSRIIPLS